MAEDVKREELCLHFVHQSAPYKKFISVFFQPNKVERSFYIQWI